MGKIVVGVDGSVGSQRALRWALEEAQLRDAEVEAVHAYAEPKFAAYPMALQVPELTAVHAAAEAALEEALTAVDVPDGVKVHRTVALGGAAGVLCEQAEDADLLVVGARGLGGFRGLLLGSVSQQVASHSPCPVVTIVPERE